MEQYYIQIFHTTMCEIYENYNVQCTLYILHCTVYNVHCTLYTVHCTVYNVHCTMYSVQCTVYNCMKYRCCILFLEIFIYNLYISLIFRNIVILVTIIYIYIYIYIYINKMHILLLLPVYSQCI